MLKTLALALCILSTCVALSTSSLDLVSKDDLDLEPEVGSEYHACGVVDPSRYKDDLLAHTNTDIGQSGCCRVYTCGEWMEANCTYCNLTAIPTDLPYAANVSFLILSHNAISSVALYPGVFANFRKLQILVLKFNNITIFPEGTFEGLEHLVHLNAVGNSILMNEDLRQSDVFRPLNSSLKTLILDGNNKDTDDPFLVYPDKALSVLSKLTMLKLDGLKGKDFGPGFGELQNLTNLTLSGYFDGYCNMDRITEKTFKHVSSVRNLRIASCNLNGSRIHKESFAPLVKMVYLDVSNNFNLGLDGIGDFMYGLRNSKTLRHLRMQRIGQRFAPCRMIFKYTLRHFRNTGLEIIEAMNNEIEMIEPGALKLLPPTLKTLNLTSNEIKFGAYWKDMGYLTGLENLHLDGYIQPATFPKYFPSDNIRCNKQSGPDDDLDILDDENVTGTTQLDICGNKSGVIMSGDGQPIVELPLPPKLKKFTAVSSSMAYTVTNITFCDTDQLEHVDLSSNKFQKLIGPLKGLNNLKQLLLRSCFVESIHPHFFLELESIEYLNLYQNLLGDSLFEDKRGYTFAQLQNLRYLNISFNNIYRLMPPVFDKLFNLEVLDISINRLSHLSFSISHMKQLKVLDLHKNQIGTIDKVNRDAISDLLKNNKSVSVNMSSNPIVCDCSNLDFLEWVLETEIFGKNYSSYYCKYPSVEHSSILMPDGYGEVIQRLRRECAPHVIIFVATAIGTLTLLAVMVGIIMYRFRWTLRYWYHAAKMKIYTKREATSDEFEYDVFVSYAHEDTDFIVGELSANLKDRHGLRLLIHGEKFQVGRHITDNIYSAVTQSRKTLVVVTRNMINSYWCCYELQMARLESIGSGRDVLVFLFLEQIPTSELRVEVVAYIKSSTYISYPENQQHRQAFWDKLARDLKSR